MKEYELDKSTGELTFKMDEPKLDKLNLERILKEYKDRIEQDKFKKVSKE